MLAATRVTVTAVIPRRANPIGGPLRPGSMRLLRSSLLVLAGLLVLVLVAGTALAGSAEAAPGAREDLVGRWVPADDAAEGRAFVEFAAGGTWTGSDGCNRTRGTGELGPDGTFAGTSGPSTMIGCENVPIAAWLSDAARAEFDGDTLVLRDASGAETGRLVPAR